MTTLRKYRTDADPSPFMGVLKKMSFHAENMGLPIVRLRQVTPDGEVTLMRAAGIEFVDIIPIKGGWEFVFKYPETLPANTGLNLNFDLKKGDKSYCVYNVKVVLPSNTTTYPLYYYNGSTLEITTMYLQVSNIVYPNPAIPEERIISCSLSIWDNSENLGTSGTSGGKHTPVSGMKFICYYSLATELGNTDYYPLNGYMVVRNHLNWHTFLSEGWLDTNGQYTVNVTMVKESGDYKNNITLEYLNNNETDPVISYVPSEDTVWSQNPLTKIKDDYSYAGSVKNYINNYIASATVPLSSVTTTYSLSATVYNPMISGDPYSVNIGPEGTWGEYNWTAYHYGLNKPNGLLSIDIMDPNFISFDQLYNIYQPPIYWKGLWLGHGPPKTYTDYEMGTCPTSSGWYLTADIATNNGGTYSTSNQVEIISSEDTYTNGANVAIPPTEWVTTWDFSIRHVIDPWWWPNMVGWSSGRQIFTSYLVWAETSKVLAWNAIQLPARNTKKSDSVLGPSKPISYYAGTSGTAGSPGS